MSNFWVEKFAKMNRKLTKNCSEWPIFATFTQILSISRWKLLFFGTLREEALRIASQITGGNQSSHIHVSVPGACRAFSHGGRESSKKIFHFFNFAPTNASERSERSVRGWKNGGPGGGSPLAGVWGQSPQKIFVYRDHRSWRKIDFQTYYEEKLCFFKQMNDVIGRKNEQRRLLLT